MGGLRHLALLLRQYQLNEVALKRISPAALAALAGRPVCTHSYTVASKQLQAEEGSESKSRQETQCVSHKALENTIHLAFTDDHRGLLHSTATISGRPFSSSSRTAWQQERLQGEPGCLQHPAGLKAAGSQACSVDRSFATAVQRREARRRQREEGGEAVVGPGDHVQPESSGETDLAERHDLEVVEPSSSRPTELQVADIVKHPALVVTRNVEWGTVLLGFEQANKYTVLDQDGNIVALLAEDSGGLGKEVGRQLLRTRRSFTATVFSPDGRNVIFRVRRPMYLINSTIFVEDGEGNVVGEVRQNFHVWQRNYSLFLGKRQFASINGGLLAWEFVLRDQDGGVLALIDRNFQGFGKELFTDAGKYVIHFGNSQEEAAEQVANTIAAAHPDKPRPKVTALAKVRTDVAVIPTSTGDQLQVARPLDLDERLLALAAAVSVDYDYFSQHSHGSGIMSPFLMPMPIPPYPAGGEVPPADIPEDTGGDAAGAAGGESGEPGSTPGDAEAGPTESTYGDSGWGQEPPAQDLGTDGFDEPDWGADEGDAGWIGGDSGGDGEGGLGWGDLLSEVFGTND